VLTDTSGVQSLRVPEEAFGDPFYFAAGSPVDRDDRTGEVNDDVILDALRTVVKVVDGVVDGA